MPPSPIALITLRNAQVRRISWVRGVRPVRGRYEWPPHDAAPDRPPFLAPSAPKTKRAPRGAPFCVDPARPAQPAGAPRNRGSLDIGFAELDVLLGDLIVFPLGELVRHGARVLPRHIEEAGVGA